MDSPDQTAKPPTEAANAWPTDVEHIQDLLESIDAIVWEFDADTFTTTYVSPQIERILGYSLEEAKADPELWLKAVHPDELDEVIALCRATKGEMIRHDFEYRIRTADGGYRWVHDATTVIREGSKPLRFRCVLTDITARHRAQEELMRSRERLAEAQRIARMGDWEWDIPNDEITWSNECFRIFGLKPQSANLSFEVFLSLLDPAAAEAIERAVEHTLREGAPYTVQHQISRPDATTITVRSYGELLRGDDGEPLCLRGTVQDITERFEIEQLKDALIALVSHELRTPLTPLIGLLSLLSNDDELQANARLAHMVTLAHKNAVRLIEVVDALLEIRELTAGPEDAFSFAVVDLYDVLLDALDHRANLDKTHVISMSPPDQDLPVRADKDRLAGVFDNLLSNAAKFSSENTTIEIHLRRVDGCARASIRDHGPGIDDAVRAQVFERFAQADGPQERHYGGLGLGLTIAKTIVERHGGRIGFESPVGGGALVFVELPLAV